MTTADPKFYTYPSISSTIFDVPEPKDISAKFEYNYFLPDEMVSLITTGSEENFIRHRKKNARQVNVEFTPLTAVIPNDQVLSEVELSDSEKKRMLTRNVDKIMSELEFLSPSTVAVKLQDSTVSSRLLADVEATLERKKIKTAALSPTETLLRYASVTTDRVDGQAMLDSVDIDGNNEYITIDPATGKPFEVQKVGDVNNLTFATVFSQKFIADIANSAVKTPLSPAATIFEGSLEDFKTAQTEARSGTSSRVIKSDDFVRTFDPVQKEKMGLDDVFLGGNTVMGYHIRKYDTLTPTDVEDIFITNTKARKWEDKEVMYGRTYNYSIAVVYLIRVFSVIKTGVIAADLLVESRESPSINVTCRESVPPQAPDGLRFYLLNDKDLVIEWDFPVNPQDDIKRFQIYKRPSTGVSFELVKELDFDDSVIPVRKSEYIPQGAVTKLQYPSTSVCDYGYDITTTGEIYAVCAVDAHDLSSGYSEQFRVSYDLFRAKLEVEFISEKNAPKAYPNFLLKTELSQDILKDSNHEMVTCFFDPEYLRVVNGEGEEVDFLQTSQNEVSYKLQLIHLNFQQSIVANINIK